VECTARNNGEHGVCAGSRCKVTLQGGAVSANAQHGVLARASGRATVAAAAAAAARQTVSEGNVQHDWVTAGAGEIEGLAADIQVVAE